MCFSATASFTASAVLGAIGAATLRTAARTSYPGIRVFAAFPVLFAMQQFVEGLLWLELARPEAGPFRSLLLHMFQGYAEVFWPVYAPLAAYLMEPIAWRRRVILACLAVGICLAAYLLVRMIEYPYFAFVAGGHILYRNNFDYPIGIEAPYVVATTVSLLLSSHQAVQALAVVILIGFFVAYAVMHDAYISVWCFMAAIASVMVYLHIRDVLRDALPRTP